MRHLLLLFSIFPLEKWRTREDVLPFTRVTRSKTFHGTYHTVNLSSKDCSLVTMLFSIANFKYCNITFFCSPVSYIINFPWVLFPWGTSYPRNTSLTLAILSSHPTSDRTLTETSRSSFQLTVYVDHAQMHLLLEFSSDTYILPHIVYTSSGIRTKNTCCHQDHKLTQKTLPPKQQ